VVVVLVPLAQLPLAVVMVEGIFLEVHVRLAASSLLQEPVPLEELQDTQCERTYGL